MTRYVFACRTGWPIDEFPRRRDNLPGEWITVTSKSDLTLDLLRPLAPRYVFFPHWSSIVPKPILAAYECVCLYMTDAPFGRGGSPLQSLIDHGIRETKLSALRMTEQLDAGPLYVKHLATVQADLIYTHHSDDLNADHRPVSEATMIAVRPMPGQKVVAVYGFETLSSTEWVFQSRGTAFRPSHFVGLVATLGRKLDALRAYHMEMRDFPHPRSYEAVASLAKLRGATVGLAAAEAFTVLREVDP
ncbi:hypothetical protein AC629_32510 [Bradyrhizobium sp. NAS80.1]|uniref:hypothetical protein n=1 Tax=Bradyrhizobium sp. NAS80.1 TaxID=1680159 RepID=UPI00096735FD|nr:hypothetical protein [Bradyrhizobium sp. NAS80.1]OKO76732.1 hypothetical protein AC629_32510 [Bradyrhizobium sp. NAS80.1]